MADEDTDATTAVDVAQLRLARFVEGDPPLPTAVLVVVAGDVRGEILAVNSSPVIVGRVADADVMIDDSTVSRRHAVLRTSEEGDLELEDLGSSNGTKLNGNPIEGALTLQDGDLVSFGTATVLVKRVR